MEKQFISLDLHENTKLTKILQTIFGIICIAVAAIWLILNIEALKTTLAFWVTILFLFVFGYYQINSGLGYSSRFIEVSEKKIRLKKNSLLPAQILMACDIEKIEFLPLNIIFVHRNKKRVILRFGTTFSEIIASARKLITQFAETNEINIDTYSEDFF